ncbi:unnamed protein product, partial [Meganyctiphanes norvegica]
EVPNDLKGNINTICNQCTAVVQICSHVTVPKLVQKLAEPLFRTVSQREEELKRDLIFLGNQESLDIYPEEVHTDDKTTWNHFISATIRNGQVFELRMPFNGKVHMLKSNKSKADGSASDVGLNQVLYQGPIFVIKLAVLLLKYMKDKVWDRGRVGKGFIVYYDCSSG